MQMSCCQLTLVPPGVRLPWQQLSAIPTSCWDRAPPLPQQSSPHATNLATATNPPPRQQLHPRPVIMRKCPAGPFFGPSPSLYARHFCSSLSRPYSHPKWLTNIMWLIFTGEKTHSRTIISLVWELNGPFIQRTWQLTVHAGTHARTLTCLTSLCRLFNMALHLHLYSIICLTLYLQADLQPTASAHAREFLFTNAMDSDSQEADGKPYMSMQQTDRSVGQ